MEKTIKISTTDKSLCNPFQFCANGCERRSDGIDRCIDPCNEAAIVAVKRVSGVKSPSVTDASTKAPGSSYHVSFGVIRGWLINFPNGCSSTPTVLHGS